MSAGNAMHVKASEEDSPRKGQLSEDVSREELDLVDQLRGDWARERPDLDTSAMGIVGRIIHLADVLKTSANRALRPFDLHYTDLDVLATLRRGVRLFA